MKMKLLAICVLFMSFSAFSSESNIRVPEFIRETIVKYLNLSPDNMQSNARLAVSNEITEIDPSSIQLGEQEAHYLQFHKFFGGEHTDLNSYKLTFRGKLESGYTFNAICEVIVREWPSKYGIFLGNNEGQCDLRIDRNSYSKFGSLSIYSQYTYASGFNVFSTIALPSIEIAKD